jgi:membrane protease YdiL (CAAX protease family)
MPATPPTGPWATFLSGMEPFIPIPVLLALIPALWLVFGSTWRELDREAAVARARIVSEGKTDLRPVVAMTMCAVILTLQEYYGGRAQYDEMVRPWLTHLSVSHPKTVRIAKYDELYSFGWWAFTRMLGYLAPLPIWKACFRQDSLLDMGFRVRGFFRHVHIYAGLLVIVVGAIFLVSQKPDFGAYYPFYKNGTRSWFDLLLWEGMYFAQFFALEVFFRGFLVSALRRSFGSGAIFAMAVPYCMIHFGKPFFEVNGAIIAGIVLGSLSMKTKSIYQGFLLHISAAGLMDWLALSHRHALPKIFWPPG